MTVRLDCILKRVSQQAYGTKRIKGKYRSESKQHTKPYTIDNDTTSSNHHSNKVYTPRTTCKDDGYTFNFTIFCNISDEHWFISYSSGRHECSPYHKDHLLFSMDRISVSLLHLSHVTDTFIVHLLK